MSAIFVWFMKIMFGTAGRYILITIAGVGFLAWIRADAAAPYKREVVALREAAARKEAILKADAERAEADRSEIERLKARVEAIAHESRLAGACQLSDVELKRLRELAM